MADTNKGPMEAVRGVIEDVKGKAKEVIGSVIGRGDLAREGQAQQDKAQAQRDAAKREAEADAARVSAKQRSSASSHTSSLSEGWIRPGIPGRIRRLSHRRAKRRFPRIPRHPDGTPTAPSSTLCRGGIVLPLSGYSALRRQTSPQEVATRRGRHIVMRFWRCLLDVLLLTNDDDFESALPTLNSFAQTTRHASLSDHVDELHQGVDVAIIDARTDPATARRVCRRLTANAPAVAVVGVVAPADFVAVDVDWHFDDVLLPTTGAVELQARLRLAITRRRSALDGTLKFGDLILHPASYTGQLAGNDLGLTLTEFKLLSFLVQHAGRAFTRTRLMHEVWGCDSNGRVRTVDVHVRRLRAKLGPEHESMVDTVRGVGYMAATPPRPQWIVSEPLLSPAWMSSSAPVNDSIAR